MRIDFHTHVWENTEDKIDDFVRELDKNRVEKAVVAPVAPINDNDQTARVVQKHPERLIGFASVLPFCQTTGTPWKNDPISELTRAIEELRLKGLKLHPSIQGFCPTDPGLSPVMEKAIEYDIPVLFHTGPSFGRAGRVYNNMLWHFDDLAIRFPEAKIVLAHAEIFHIGPYLAAKHPNVYLETSGAWVHYCGLIPGIGEETCEICGAEKVLFGTDMNPGKVFRQKENMSVIENLSISREDKAKILGENAQRLLKIP